MDQTGKALGTSGPANGNDGDNATAMYARCGDKNALSMTSMMKRKCAEDSKFAMTARVPRGQTRQGWQLCQ
jgi:hypothetical protein